MKVSKADIESWDSNYRVKFVNSVSGYKGVHLIGTKSKDNSTNAAVFNSIVHISSNPARVGFIMRPLTVSRHTYQNIKDTTYFTLNHVHKAFAEQAHFTSAKFKTEESEFDLCNLTETYKADFYAPFVEESNIQIGLRLIDDIELTQSEGRLIIGEVELVDVNEEYVEEDGQIDLEKANDVCVTGLNQYSSVQKFVKLPYAKVEDAPNFKQKKRPDNIVFDEDTQSYNAKTLTYGTNIGAPSIISNNLSTWKNSGIRSYNHVLKSKVEKIKEQYDYLVEEYKDNNLLYNAKYEFEPIIGEVYHLYAKENKDENFLSLIHPSTWKRKHLGSFKLSSEKVWEKVEI